MQQLIPRGEESSFWFADKFGLSLGKTMENFINFAFSEKLEQAWMDTRCRNCPCRYVRLCEPTTAHGRWLGRYGCQKTVCPSSSIRISTRRQHSWQRLIGIDWANPGHTFVATAHCISNINSYSQINQFLALSQMRLDLKLLSDWPGFSIFSLTSTLTRWFAESSTYPTK